MASIRWVLLDIGGVLELVDDAAWPARFADRWAPRLGLSRARFDERLAAADLPDAATRDVEEEYWTALGDAVVAPAAILAAMRADFWDEYCGTANTELLTALPRWRRHVGLAALSNSGAGARREEERRYGFAALLDPICYSHEIGVQKPDPRAFAIALERMAASPEQVLFIDDVLANVEAARRLGLQAHLHRDTAGTIARVEDALVS